MNSDSSSANKTKIPGSWREVCFGERLKGPVSEGS